MLTLQRMFYCSPKSIFANQYLFFVFICFCFFCEKSSVFFAKKKISYFFSSLFVFCSSRFVFTSVFRIRFCLIFCFLDLLLHELIFFYFTFFSFFFGQQLPFTCVSRKLFKNSLLTCMRYLFMSSLCSHICSSVVSPLSLSFLSHLFSCSFFCFLCP